MPEVSVVLQTTGRRQEKSTGVTDRSAGEVGVAPGGAAGAALVDGDRTAPGLTLAVEPDELQAATTRATRTSGHLIVGFNGPAERVLRRRCCVEPFEAAHQKGRNERRTRVVAPAGFEPAISALRRLRPRPLDDGATVLVGRLGFEPTPSC